MSTYANPLTDYSPKWNSSMVPHAGTFEQRLIVGFQ
jgi:hypothetical protein